MASPISFAALVKQQWLNIFWYFFRVNFKQPTENDTVVGGDRVAAQVEKCKFGKRNIT